MAGWRLGYVIGPRKLIEKMGLLMQTIFSCLPGFTQMAAISVLKNDTDEIQDGIGDMVVVLTNLSELIGIPIEECIARAYDVISKRTGKMVNGTFKKDE